MDISAYSSHHCGYVIGMQRPVVQGNYTFIKYIHSLVNMASYS